MIMIMHIFLGYFLICFNFPLHISSIRQVAGIVDNLKSMAMEMGGELDKQNTQIDRITDKVSKSKRFTT